MQPSTKTWSWPQKPARSYPQPWTESVTRMTTGGEVTHLVEIGAGKVLSGLAKRIAPEASAVSVGLPADIDAFIASLSE